MTKGTQVAMSDQGELGRDREAGKAGDRTVAAPRDQHRSDPETVTFEVRCSSTLHGKWRAEHAALALKAFSDLFPNCRVGPSTASGLVLRVSEDDIDGAFAQYLDVDDE